MQVCNLYITVEEFAHMRRTDTQKLHQAGSNPGEPVAITLRSDVKNGEFWRRTIAMARYPILNQQVEMFMRLHSPDQSAPVNLTCVT